MHMLHVLHPKVHKIGGTEAPWQHSNVTGAYAEVRGSGNPTLWISILVLQACGMRNVLISSPVGQSLNTVISIMRPVTMDMDMDSPCMHDVTRMPPEFNARRRGHCPEALQYSTRAVKGQNAA